MKYKFLIQHRALLAALACAMLILVPGESTRAGTPELRSIKVISYNVQFLPGPGRAVNKRKNLPYRAETLGRLMANYDIVGLQETFDDEPREKLLAALKAQWGDEYHVVVHPRPDEKRFNGGLLIASRFPFIETNFMHYTVFSKPEDFGVTADGFAGKGVLHARIDLPGKGTEDYVDVFVTHLEARADDLRPAQYLEMAAFIKAHSDNRHPTLIMGDMNTKGMLEQRNDPGSQYSQLLKAFSDAREGSNMIDVWPYLMGEARGATTEQETTEKGSRIDYVFVSNPLPENQYTAFTPRKVSVNGFLDPQVVALSDHSAVEVEFDWWLTGK